MNFDEMKQGWQIEVNQSPDGGDLWQSLLEIQKQCESLESIAYRRDMREILEAFLVVGVSIAMWPWIWHSTLASCGFGLIVLGYFLNLWTLLSCRRSPPVAFDASLSESLSQRLSWVDRQIHILTRSIWWIAAPSLVGVPLVALDVTGAITPVFILLMILYAVAGVHYFKSRSKKANLYWIPLRKEVQHTIEGLS